MVLVGNIPIVIKTLDALCLGDTCLVNMAVDLMYVQKRSNFDCKKATFGSNFGFV